MKNTCLAVNQIASFDPEDEAVELYELGGDRPHTLVGFAVSPDGRWMVGTTELTGTVFVFDLDRAPVLTPVDTLAVNAAPWHPVFTPDGRWVYVGNNRDNTVNVNRTKFRRSSSGAMSSCRPGPTERTPRSRSTPT